MLIKMKSHWTGVSPEPKDWCIRERRRKGRPREEGAEMGGMRPQAKERMPGAFRGSTARLTP